MRAPRPRARALCNAPILTLPLPALPLTVADNLAAIGAVTLTPAEIAALSTRPLDTCDIDGSFYECVPVAGFAAPASPFTTKRA